MPMRISEKEAAALLSGSAASRGRYQRTRTQDGSLTFDSAMEHRRWQELLLLQRDGQIRGLRRQVSYQLAPAVRLLGVARQIPPLRYVADYVYEEVQPTTSGFVVWLEVVEDCKGHRDRIYKMKRHLMKSVLGLDIRETKPR